MCNIQQAINIETHRTVDGVCHGAEGGRYGIRVSHGGETLSIDKRIKAEATHSGFVSRGDNVALSLSPRSCV